MSLIRSTLAVALIGAVAWLTCAAALQEGKPLPDGMKRWQEACTPGPAHKDLARFIGTWDTETVMFGMGDVPAVKGTAEWKWLFDGRWIQMSSSGELMGRPYHTQMTMGYDNFRQKYTSAGVDDLQTVLLTCEGNFDQSRQALIMYGKIDEPMTGEIEKTFKSVWRFAGPDKFTHEVHDLAIGETNTKVFEIVYTRHK
jgi:hypothetical protein